jgi:hypothetical protein
MSRTRFVYWVHTNPSLPSKIFKLKRDAAQWGRSYFIGPFIIEPIATLKLPERIAYIRDELGYRVARG